MKQQTTFLGLHLYGPYFQFNLPTDKIPFGKSVQRLLHVLVFAILFPAVTFAQSYTFTPAGASGNFGPTQAQVNAAYTGTSLDGLVTVNTQGIQVWTVPVTASYSIAALGGQGGRTQGTADTYRGAGASIIGEFALTAGQVINIVVGQEGLANTQGNFANGGGFGGGGSFIWITGNTEPLVTAGGGGGGSIINITPSGPPNSLTFCEGNGGNTGIDGTSSSSGVANYGTAGGNATGGTAPAKGWNTMVLSANFNGQAFGFYGGIGGFGGGGGAVDSAPHAGGGGGGYSGGGGGQYQLNSGTGNIDGRNGGGGGGSYNAGTNQINIAGVNSGNGQVVFTELNAVPVVTCPGNIIMNNDTGICGAVVSYTVTATDAEDGTLIPVQTTGLPSGSIFPIGTTTNTFEVTDSNGNTSACSFDVTVNDTEAPVITCPADITVSNDAGLCGAVVNYASPATITFSQAFVAGQGSPHCNEWLDFQSQLLSTYNYTKVTIKGSNDPIGVSVTDPAKVLQLANALRTSTATSIFDNGRTWVTGGCGLDMNNNPAITLSASGQVCQCENNEYTVRPCIDTYTVNPNWGGVGTVTCSGPSQVITVEFEIAGGGGGFVITDNCDNNPSIVQTAGLPSGSVFPVGTTTNTFEATDAAGNTATCSFDVTVEDNEAPVANCAAPFTIQLDANGNASVNATDIDNGSTDNCAIASVDFSETLTAYATANEGQNLSITLPGGAVVESVIFASYGTPNGSNGNYTIGSCHAANSQAIVESYALGNNSFTIPADNGIFGDPCGGTVKRLYVTVSYISSATITNFDCSNVGPNPVTLTVTDVNGNISTCTTIVTVEDNVAPIANCAAPFTIQLDANGNASITVADIENGSTDACGIASTTIDVTDFDCSNVGDSTVTLTVTDVNGNVSTCTTIVTVEDNVAPIANCAAPFTIQLDANGNATITVADIENGSTDACGIASTTIDIDTFDCSNVGDNTVTLTVTDVNGNVSTCTTIVTVEDSIAPIIACPADITANTDPADCFATVSFPEAIALDACGVDTVVQTAGLPSGSEFPVGISNIEFTATDVNGNVSVCSFNITVIDNQMPVAVCQNITIQLDEFGNASITATDLDGGSTDNCGVATTTIDIDTFDCSNVGPNNVTLTVTDIHGNVSTCIAVVTVEDVTAPVVVCQNITVQLDANGTVTIAGTDIDNGSTDACGIASYDLDMATFDCSNVGDNLVTLTVTDVNGNTATCTATVTVEDVTAPVLVCQDFTLELGADGTATLDPSDVIASNEDACGIFTIAVDITEFDCSDIGTPVIVQVFAQDNNGNLATCNATVTVVDALAPVITCPGDQTIDPGANNLFYILPDYFATGEATATDNCTDPVTIFTQNPAPGTALPDGLYTITLTAEDAYGNVSECTFELTVESILGANDPSVSMGSVQLYPNPAKDVITFGNPQLMDLQQATIYDLMGRLVQTINLEGMGATKTINVQQLSAATYIVMIKGKTGQVTKRLIKE